MRAPPSPSPAPPAGRFPGAPQGGALEGLTVIDLTMMLAGPYASMMLADQGARVIKVEPPGGDNTRRIGPWAEGQTRMEDGGYGAYFASINRNKRSVVLDLKAEDGKAALLRMIAQADVVIENYRLGVMDRLGLPWERLQEINPRLVYASVRGFGDRRGGASPYADWPAYDPIAQAMGGIMGITGPEKDGPPTKIGMAYADIMTGLYSVIGIQAALHQRVRAPVRVKSCWQRARPSPRAAGSPISTRSWR